MTRITIGIRVVIKVDIAPTARVVAIGTLARPMPGWRQMA
jgi:hypothetical protein